jgi:hypothetical protein
MVDEAHLRPDVDLTYVKRGSGKGEAAGDVSKAARDARVAAVAVLDILTLIPDDDVPW